MSNNFKSDDHLIFNVFEQLARLAFNCKWEGKDILARGTEPIKQENLSLLLAWPGILMMKLVQITGDNFYDKALKELYTNLQKTSDYLQAKKYLDKLISPNSVPTPLHNKLHNSIKINDFDEISKLKKELYNYTPEIITKTILLLHPRNLAIVTGTEIFTLFYSLTIFFVLWCMLVRCFYRNDNDIYITKIEMYEIYSKHADINCLDIFSLSRIFPTILDFFIEIDIENFDESFQNDEKLNAFDCSNITTPSIHFFLQRTFPNNNVAYIKKSNPDKVDFGINSELRGIGYNIMKALGFKTELWRSISFNNPKANGYLFINKEKDDKDLISNLYLGMIRSAYISAQAIELVHKSWDDFIDNPYDKVGDHLDIYYNWIEAILLNDYLACDEFYKFKNFGRAIGDIDIEIDVPVVKEVRKLYKDGKRNHIPWKHIKELLAAKRELDNFIDEAIEKKYFTEDKYIKHYKIKKDQYKYLCHLEEEDLHNIGFSTAGNIPRDNYRKIISIINEKLGGRKLSESRLTILLGLETSDLNYAKFAF